MNKKSVQTHYPDKIKSSNIVFIRLLLILLLLQHVKAIFGVSPIISYQKPSASQVYCMEFGSDNDTIYYAIYDMVTGKYQMERYSITALSVTPINPPLVVYTLTDQISIPDKML